MSRRNIREFSIGQDERRRANRERLRSRGEAAWVWGGRFEELRMKCEDGVVFCSVGLRSLALDFYP